MKRLLRLLSLRRAEVPRLSLAASIFFLVAVNDGIVKKAGAFYSYGDTRLGQGREAAKDFLNQHLEIAQSIEARVRGQEPSLQPATNGTDPTNTGEEHLLSTATEPVNPE